MITTILEDCTSDIKAVYEMEEQSLNLKKQAIIFDAFKSIVDDVNNIVNEMENATNALSFKPTKSIVIKMADIVNRCIALTKSQNVSEAINTNLKGRLKEIRDLLSNEWRICFQDNAAGYINTLKVLSDVTDDQNIQYAIGKIKKAENWNRDITNIERLNRGLSEAKQIIDDYSLDKEIETFLQNVGNKTATIQSLTPKVTKWLLDKGLANKFSISFN